MHPIHIASAGAEHRKPSQDTFLHLRLRHAVRRRLDAKETSATLGGLGASVIALALCGVGQYYKSPNSALILSAYGGMAVAAAFAYRLYRVTAKGKRFAHIRWHCPGCGKTLHDRKWWYCSYCDTNNGKRSFLDRCGNERCEAAPLSYECEHCGALTYLTPARDGRHPARFKIREAERPKTPEELRSERAHELEEREHERKRLILEVEVARLKKLANQTAPVVVDPHQARVNRMAERIEEAKVKCKTLKDAILWESQAHAEIDADSTCPEVLKGQFKDIVSTACEGIRLDLAGEARR